VGLATVPPPLGPAAEQAAADAARQYGLDDLRGSVAARLHAYAPLARFDLATYARRLAALYDRTGAPELLRRLAEVLRSPAPRGPAADAAFVPFADPAQLRLGSAAVDLCRARVARGETAEATRIKEAARAEGLLEPALAGCVVAPTGPTGTVAGTVAIDGAPAADLAVALLDDRAAQRLDATPRDQPFDLSLLAATPVTRTDAAGSYRFDGLPDGRYRLAVLLADARLGLAAHAGPAPPAWLVVAAHGTVQATPLELTTRFE
jgi:hypothetical protein